MLGLGLDITKHNFIVAGCTPPTVLTSPTISGGISEGDVLTVTGGTFSGTVNSLAYQWQSDGFDIAGETGTTYTITSDVLGTYITCNKTALSGCGNATGVSNILVPEYNALAQSYFDRVLTNGGTALTAPLKVLLNQFFIDAQAGGYLPNLRLHLYANEHEIAACTNLISDSFLATLVNSPTFTQYDNIQPNGSTGYINTGYKPSDGSLDDATYGFYQTNNATIQSAGVTGHGSNNSGLNRRSFILPNNTGNIEGNINGPANTAVIQTGQTTEIGQSTITRISATQIKGGRNGVWGSAVNETSTSLAAENFYEGAVNNAGTPIFYSNSKMVYSFNSSGWTEAKDLAFYNRMQTLLTAIAAL